LIRAVKKEQKHYHFDWSLVPDMSARFENMIASHLLKWVHYQRDVFGEQMELRYFRDTDKREVDFCITRIFRHKCLLNANGGIVPQVPICIICKKNFPMQNFTRFQQPAKNYL